MNKKREIYLILGIGAMIMFFSACVDINLKSEIPHVTYYTLDNAKDIQHKQKCESSEIVALSHVDMSPEYKSNKILYTTGGRAHYMKNAGFVSISQSLENMIAKEFHTRCLNIALPPFSSFKIDQYLGIRLIDFYIDKDSNKIIINMLYQISSGGVSVSDIISISRDINAGDDEASIKSLSSALGEAVSMLADMVTSVEFLETR